MLSIAARPRPSQARLTSEQLYVFNAVLDLFGKDTEENISILFTFADAQEPPALEVLRKEGIPHNEEGRFKFNNSALYAEPDKSEGSGFYWDFGYDSMERFFRHIARVTPSSLKQTKEVLLERQQLQEHLERLTDSIGEGMDNLREMEDVTKKIMDLRGTMQANANYKVQRTR